MIKLKLICPQCFKEMEWTGKDFEEMVDCSCGYSDEAWYFWHTTIPTFKEGGKFIYSRGAHYTNGALTLGEELFTDQFLGRFKGMVHGGTFDIWVRQYDFVDKENPNSGSVSATIVYDAFSVEGLDKNLEDLGKEIIKFSEWLKKKYRKD